MFAFVPHSTANAIEIETEIQTTAVRVLTDLGSVFACYLQLVVVLVGCVGLAGVALVLVLVLAELVGLRRVLLDLRPGLAGCLYCSILSRRSAEEAAELGWWIYLPANSMSSAS